jgi:ribosome maturation factor RimP
MEASKVNEAINLALAAHEAYLVELEMLPGNNINIFVDVDGGIKVNQLKLISRAIEAALDREVEDFALTVSSPGLDRPFRVHRQFVNNVGRWLKVKTKAGEALIGELTVVTDTALTLNIPGKKKKDSAIDREIAFEEIEESKIEIRF